LQRITHRLPSILIQRNYLDLFMELPGTNTQDKFDLKRAQKILEKKKDRDRYGLERC